MSDHTKNRTSSGQLWNFITKQPRGTWAGQRQSPGRGAPGRPGPLHYEPNQNGRKSGRGGLEGPKAVEKVFGFPEKPPRSAGKHSREGGHKHKVCVSRPRGGKIPGKHAKTTVFNPTPRPLDPSGCKNIRREAASPFNKLRSDKPRTGFDNLEFWLPKQNALVILLSKQNAFGILLSKQNALGKMKILKFCYPNRML